MDERGFAPTGLMVAGLVGTLAGAALVAVVLTGSARQGEVGGPVTVDPAAVTSGPTVPGASSGARPPSASTSSKTTTRTTRSSRPAPTGGPVAPKAPVASDDDDDDDDDDDGPDDDADDEQDDEDDADDRDDD